MSNKCETQLVFTTTTLRLLTRHTGSKSAVKTKAAIVPVRFSSVTGKVHLCSLSITMTCASDVTSSSDFADWGVGNRSDKGGQGRRETHDGARSA